MPKSIIPAAGEAMPVEVESPIKQLYALLEGAVKIIRDNPDLMIDNVTANKHGVYTVLDIPGVASAPQDPLLDAIKAYRAGLVEFNRLAEADKDDKRWKEHGAATYEPWQAVLDEWSEPARSCEGAIEALRAAISEQDGVCGTPAAEKLINAALAYLEGVRA